MVSHYQLKNGLKVILVQSHKAPVVSLQAWVRTGSADETPAEAGISHFIEHLLFKGTRKFAVGEIAQIIEGSGGELNAYTSFDQTVFYMTLSNQFTRTGLEALSEMMGFPSFDPAEIDAEREVVVEEMRRGNDSLGRKASQLLFETAYPQHPYGRPVIGYEKVVRTVTPKTIAKYFNSRYVPRNMFLLISGDFEKSEIKNHVQEFFGELSDRKVKPVKRKKAPVQKKSKIKVLPSAFEQSICYVAWPIPPITHQDIPALDLLSFILGGGETSRLVKELRIHQAMVESVGASTFTPSDRGLFLISLAYGETPLEEILEKVNNELAHMLSGNILAEEIQRSVTLLSSEEFFSLETVDGLARKYGHLEFHFKDLRMTEKYIKMLRETTIADLVKVAQKYLDPKKISATVLTKKDPAGDNKALQAFVKTYETNFRQNSKAKVKPKKIPQAKIPKIKFSKSTPEIELITLPTGDRLLIRKSTETPMISARVATLAGTRMEPKGKSGLSELVSRTWMGGTTNRDEVKYAEEVEKIAANISPLAGRNSLSLGLDVLSQFEEKGKELFFDALMNPLFSDEVFNRERTVLLRQIQTKKDNPAQIASNRFMEALFKGHPYSKDVLGQPGEIQSLTAKETSNWWREYLTGGRKHFVLCGAVDRKAWEKEITEFSKKQKSKHHNEELSITYPTQDIRVFEKAEKEQSHLIVGYPGLTLRDPDRYTLQIIQSILAGQGGRLFIELRDKNSLAYSVSPMRMEGMEGGYFGAYIGCAPEKVDQALRMLREEFRKLCDTNVPDEELKRAQRYIVGRQDIDLQRTSAIAGSILFNDIYGIDYNEAFNCADKYWSVTAADVRRIAEKIFSQKGVISLVGPRDF